MIAAVVVVVGLEPQFVDVPQEPEQQASEAETPRVEYSASCSAVPSCRLGFRIVLPY